jgi:hypothetical protein
MNSATILEFLRPYLPIFFNVLLPFLFGFTLMVWFRRIHVRGGKK